MANPAPILEREYEMQAAAVRNLQIYTGVGVS